MAWELRESLINLRKHLRVQIRLTQLDNDITFVFVSLSSQLCDPELEADFIYLLASHLRQGDFEISKRIQMDFFFF